MRSLNDLAWQKGNTLSHFLVPKQWQLGLTGLAGFAGSVLLKIGCLLLRLYSKLSTFGLFSHLHSVGHWSCVRVNMDAVIADVTLKLMSARVHPSWREKLPEESSLNTLWCRKHHTSLMPLRQAFRCPTGHLVANHSHVCADLQQLVFMTNFLKGLLFNEEQVTFEWHVLL